MWKGIPYFVEIDKTIITILKIVILLFEKKYHFHKFFAKNTLSLQSNNLGFSP